MILRFTKLLSGHPGPQNIVYKLVLLVTFIPVLISIVCSNSRISTVASIHLTDNSHVEISRSVEPKVLARLESQFLKLLGMKQRPAKRLRPLKVPKYLIELYEAQTGSKLETSNLHLPGRYTKTANTVRSFYHDAESSDVEWGTRLKFDLSSMPVKEKVTGAELRFLFNTKDSDSAEATTESATESTSGDNNVIRINLSDFDSMGSYDSVRVLVNDVIKPPKGSSPDQEPIMHPIDSKLIDLAKRKGDSFWITLDVFPAVARWLENPKRNHGLVIQVVHPNGQVMPKAGPKHVRVRRDATYEETVTQESDPVLFTYSDDGLNKKQRDAKTLSRAYRAANPQGGQANGGGGKKRKNHRPKNRKRNLCARHKMFVDFTDVGWNDWIVAPPGYPAYHCAGECPFPMAEHLNATNHAVIQALVNSMTPQVVPPPCCVPTKYSSLSLLYTDSSDKIVLKNYNEMVVDACGCS